MINRKHKTISIADQIFEQLEKDILAGKYPRGEVLSESKLSEELGVSRTPVREAIKRLVQEHILLETKKGITVMGITRQDMSDMYDIRLRIEGDVGTRAAENMTEKEIEELSGVLDLQKYYVEKGEPQVYADQIKDLDTRFHAILYMGSRSMAYADVLIPIHRKMTKYRKASVSKMSRARDSIKEHEEILEAIKAHNPQLAGEKMANHTEQAKNRMMSLPETDDD